MTVSHWNKKVIRLGNYLVGIALLETGYKSFSQQIKLIRINWSPTIVISFFTSPTMLHPFLLSSADHIYLRQGI